MLDFLGLVACLYALFSICKNASVFRTNTTRREKKPQHSTRAAQTQHCAQRQDEETEIPDELRSQQI